MAAAWRITLLRPLRPPCHHVRLSSRFLSAKSASTTTAEPARSSDAIPNASLPSSVKWKPTSSQSSASPAPPPPPSTAPSPTTPTTAQPPGRAPTATTAAELPPLPYHVARTLSQQLPVYHERKGGGGGRRLTVVRRVTGSAAALRADLVRALGLAEAEAWVNATTGHVVLKGWLKKDVANFLIHQHF